MKADQVKLTVWMKHPTGSRWRKDAVKTGTLAETIAEVTLLYARYNSTDIRCEMEWQS